MITHPRLILLCGLPGSGKTTLAQRMEQAWPVVRFCPDEWNADLGIDPWDGAFRLRLLDRIGRRLEPPGASRRQTARTLAGWLKLAHDGDDP